MTYRHTQMRNPLLLTATAVSIVAMTATFGRLTVSVGPSTVDVAFGWGLPRRSVPLRDVVEQAVVRTPIWAGRGIRRVRNGWLYNVAGRDAVALTLASGSVVRIGTDDPQGLLDAVAAARDALSAGADGGR